MSTIAAYAVEAETAKELKKGQFKLHHQKTPPTNVVLLDIHDTDTEEVKYVKRLINQMRQELGNSTDLIKIEPETALFNILYTKKEVDQLIVSTGSGFNLPMFLNSVLLAGANLIKLRSDNGEHINTEHYTEYFNATADNFEYVYLKLKEYANKFADFKEQLQIQTGRINDLTNTAEIFNNELETLTGRVDELEEDVSKIESCTCDKEWMRFMKQNFKEGIDDDEIVVDGNIDLQGKHGLYGLTEMNTHNGVLLINGSLYTNDKIKASNLPSQLTFRPNGVSNEDNYITDDGVVEYNTYGKWYQPCDIETFGSIDVDNRLRINTLDTDKTSIIKTVDVGAALEDFEERIETLESGGGGGDGFWKLNPTHMQSLPEHPSLETYDFITKSHDIAVKNIDDNTIFVYFPDLSVDLSYDRAQFIEIKSTNPPRTWYISTKNNQMEFPMIIDYQTLQEETVLKNDINHVGMLWRRQYRGETTELTGCVKDWTYWSVYLPFSLDEVYPFADATKDKPVMVIVSEYDEVNTLIRTSTFVVEADIGSTDEIKGTSTIPGEIPILSMTLHDVTTPGVLDGVYYISGVDNSKTVTCTWTRKTCEYEISINELTDRIVNNSITFEYTPDRDKIINNEPPSITSTELVKNDTVITAPNTFDLHKYGGVKDYEIRLDKLVIDDKSIASYNKISFKDFQIGGDYVGPIFTIYFGTTRFMMNNEQILTPISCYLNEDGKYMTDQLLKKDGFWTTELVETDMPCFLWSKTCPITLQEAYNIGEITIKYIPRKSTLSVDHDVICREVVADNALELYRSSSPNFYNPKIITEAVYNIRNYYVIDFGYSTDSDEFKQLPEGFRFRFIDPVFSYNYEAVKEKNDWKFKYGNLHPNVNTSRFSTDNLIDYGGIFGNETEGPCVIMNSSNEIALTYLVKHCLGHDVSGWENMWKALWNDSRATITIDGPVELHKDKVKTSKKEEGKNQYCYIVLADNGTAKKHEKYDVKVSLKISTDAVDVDLRFEWVYNWSDMWTESTFVPYMSPIYDCYEVLNFSQHGELTFEYEEHGKGLRFYASPDFLLWKADINYEKGTNIFRFLYDRDYVQIEPRPESCSALMTDKNIITDGIVVAQNLETHLHSLNQVANVTEETIERMKFTDAVLGEIIANLAELNEFVRITILTDFVCLGFSGLMGVVKFGEGVMKNGLRSTLRLDDMPIISTAMRDGTRYTRIGESVTDMVQDARSMELVARDTIREEAQVINRAARDITEEAETVARNVSRDITDAGENITQTARETIHQQAREVEVTAVRHQTQVEEDFSIFAGEISGEASEMDLYVESNLSIRAGEINNRTGRTTFGELLDENTPLLAVDGDRVAMVGSYGRAAGDYILGLFNRAGQSIRNGAGIVFNASNIASLVENIWWVLDTYKDAIGWSVQFGGSIFKLFEIKKYNQGIDLYFTPDRFIWSVVDAEGIKIDHTIVGIAKYNEMSGWNDEKLITGQALLENYYSKGEIDQMLASNGSNSGTGDHTHTEYYTKEEIDQKFEDTNIKCTLDNVYYETDKYKVSFEPLNTYGFAIKNDYTYDNDNNAIDRLSIQFKGRQRIFGQLMFNNNNSIKMYQAQVLLEGCNIVSQVNGTNNTHTIAFGNSGSNTTMQLMSATINLEGNASVIGGLTVNGDLTAPNIYTKDEVDALISDSSNSGTGTFDTSILDNYATIQYVDTKAAEHTHSGFISPNEKSDFRFHENNVIRWIKDNILVGQTMYLTIGSNWNYCFGMEYTVHGEMRFKFDYGDRCNTLVTMIDDEDNPLFCVNHNFRSDGPATFKSNVTINGDLITTGRTKTRYITVSDEGGSGTEYSLYVSGGALYYRNDTTSNAKVLSTNSQTITHETNIIGEIGSGIATANLVGTFCESNGKIYDGYEKIGETDCICQVKQSKSLNKKIIGIITSETQFASHGDVLVRVNDISDCSVGDILVPDENGCGKVASEQDLMFMMLHAIPRPKITSLNTGIDGMVACFIV